MNKILIGVIIGIGITLIAIFYETQLVSLIQSSTDSPQAFKDRLDQINSKFSQLKSQYAGGQINMTYYNAQVFSLHKAEQDLYSNVKSYKWSDSQLTDYNFWYRGTMKFPSILDQEYQKMGNLNQGK